jgi:nucleoside-diphosphate kinase
MAISRYQSFIVILKPDAISRHLVGAIISRFERAGFDIIEARLDKFVEEMWMQHYIEHCGADHYEALCKHMANKPVMIMHVGGRAGINRARRMIGSTDPKDAAPGTIRGDFGNITGIIADNLVHVSDSMKSADREYKLWFGGNNGE